MLVFILATILLRGTTDVTTLMHEYIDIGQVYVVSSTAKGLSQQKGEEWCAEQSSYLVNIESRIEMSNLQYYLDPIAVDRKACLFPVWTGGKYNTTSNKWIWPHSSQIIDSHTGWCDGNPTSIVNRGTDIVPIYNACVAISCETGKTWCLVNYMCSIGLTIVCEKRLKAEVTPPPPIQLPPPPYVYPTLDEDRIPWWIF